MRPHLRQTKTARECSSLSARSALAECSSQCIHDGFGLRRFGERLAGPEYVERFMDKIAQSDIEAACNTFVTRAEKTESGFAVTLVSREGLRTVTAKSLVLATAAAREAQSRFLSTERARQECSLPAQRSISQTVSVSCRRKNVLSSVRAISALSWRADLLLRSGGPRRL